MGEAPPFMNAKKGKLPGAKLPPPSLTGLTGRCCRYDVDVVRLSTSIDGDIKSYINNNKSSKIYVLHPNQKPHLQDPHTIYSSQPNEVVFDTEQLQKAMDNARVRKCPHEIRLIRHANAVTASAHRSVLRALRSYDNEAQIQATFLDTCVANNAKNQAYEIIAASGENASTLHYVKNNQSLKGKQVVCLDAGCEWACYASDVTRTFPISGRWSTEAKEIHDLVQEMQNACIERIRPGVRYLDLHILAHQIAIRGLLRLGIMHGGTECEIYEAGTSMAFFPHGQ
jgi:Xaa-Pro aminopeptidase